MSEIVNQGNWGICGFVSVLNGLRAAGKLTKWTASGSVSFSLPEIQTRIYAEIVTYLKYLIFTRSPLLQQIEDISHLCKPKGETERSVADMVRFIEELLRGIGGKKGVAEKTMQTLIVEGVTEDFTIAMTPDSLLDYMTWAGVKNAKDLKVETTQNTSDNLMIYTNCIIGLGERPGLRKYNGLEHWIYVTPDGVLNNWGEKTTLTPGKHGTDLFGKWARFITHVIRMA